MIDKITGSGTLEGGKGNDTLTANVAGSSDTFIFNKGDGQDTIVSLDTAKKESKGTDTLILQGINRAEMTCQRLGNNLILILGANDQITLTNYFLNANYQTLETVKFDDGDWNIKADGITLTGGFKNDTITGSIWNDSIYGGYFGDDVITDIHGDNYLDGGHGNDKITGKGTLVGGKGNDTLTANVAGSSDTFIFNKGDGKDIINSIDAGKIKGSDTLILQGINRAEMTCQRIGNNLILILGANDQITLTNYFLNANYQTLEIVKFDDGDWNIKADGLTLTGTDKNENITGMASNDTIYGAYGNDTITDIQGRNYLDGGLGNDKITGTGTLVGGLGNDTLTANIAGSSDTFIFNKGDGQDTIISLDTHKTQKGSDILKFGAGITKDDISMEKKGNNLILHIGTNRDQITFTNYYLNTNYQTIKTVEFDGGVSVNFEELLVNGSIGNDIITGSGTLLGGKGNDTITAKVAGSSDTFIFNKGDGKDVINSIDTGKIKGSDIILLKGINKAEMNCQRLGNNLILIFNSNDQITLTNYFAGPNYQTIDTVKFDDGEWNIKAEGITFTGTDKNDKLIGGTWDDTVNGGKGDDIITDIHGNNYLDGGEHNDKITGKGTLVGGKGSDILTANVAGSSDTFIFNKGDGQDTIVSLDTAKKESKGTDTLILQGINRAEMTCQRLGNNLILILGANDQITLTNYFLNANYQTLETVKFDDGDWNIKADGITLTGGFKNDTITGSIWNDSIYGGYFGDDVITDIHGDNYLDGGHGNDKITGKGTLVGGKGNDTLTANVAGSSDTFIFNKGDGKDIINSIDAGKIKGSDTLILKGINRAEMTCQRIGNNLILILGANDQITLTNYFLNANYQTLEIVKFDDGDWNIKADGLTLTGTDKNENITGMASNDTIYGAYGNDTITDTQGRNYLDGGLGNDKITGTGTLVGGLGNDTLTANIAGSSDTFIFNKGDGQDTIISLDTHKTQKGSDTIQFEYGISTDDVTYEVKGQNLIFKLGGDDQITINNYFAGANYQTIKKLEFQNGSYWKLIPKGANGFEIEKRNYSASEPLSAASLMNQTNGLISAMASFAPPASSDTLNQNKPLEISDVLLAVNVS